MPKASFASKDQYHLSLGFQEGWAEIVAASTQVYQFPPNKETGKQSPPFLAQVIVFQKTDEKGVRTSDEPIQNEIKIEGDLNKMRPGRAKSRDDQEPEDLSDELGTTGNCVFSEGAKVSDKSPWGVLSKSLEEKGFRSDILGEGYSPDLVGIKGYFKQIVGEKFKTRDTGEEKQASYLVCDKLTVRPYESKGKPAAAPAKAAKPAAAKSSSPAIAPAETSTPTSTPGSSAIENGDLEGIAVQLLSDLARDLTGQALSTTKLYSALYGRLLKLGSKVDRASYPSIQAMFKSSDWLTDQFVIGELGEFDGETATFAAA